MSTPSTVPDVSLEARLRAAFDKACRALGAATPRTPDTWGWKARTLGGAIDSPTGPMWLRIARKAHARAPSVFWTGNRDAQRDLPATVPRPTLVHSFEFTQGEWDCCAEAFDLIAAPAFSDRRTATSTPPSHQWWHQLRTALHAVADVRTDRFTISPEDLNTMTRRLLGPGHRSPPPSTWQPAHGDLHWANLTGPPLTILDWESWGLAPPGYDAATLLAYSLPDRDTASAVRRQFADQLDTPAGRWVQIAVLAEQLTARSHEEPQDRHTQLMRASLDRLVHDPRAQGPQTPTLRR